MITSKLPDAYDPPNPGAALRLLLWIDIPAIEGLVEEGQDEGQTKHVNRENEPEGVAPFMGSSDDKVGEHWAEVWSREPHTRPDANFPGPLVEIKHVFDKGKPGDEARGKYEALKALQCVIRAETWGQNAAESEKATQQDGPKSDRSPSPAR